MESATGEFLEEMLPRDPDARPDNTDCRDDDCFDPREDAGETAAAETEGFDETDGLRKFVSKITSESCLRRNGPCGCLSDSD